MLSRFLPDRLSQWLAALVVGGILLTQAFALSLYHADRARVVERAETNQAAQCLAGFAQLLGPESPDHRRRMIRRLMFGEQFGAPDGFHEGGGPPNWPPPPDFPPIPKSDLGPPGFNGVHPPAADHPPEDLRPPAEFLIHLPEMPVGPPPYFGPPPFIHHVQAESILADGTRLTLDARPQLGRLFTPDFAAYIAAVIGVGLIGSIWAVSLATKPLRRLSDAADRFGVDVNAAPLPETGPREVRQAAAAFNKMQRRLRQFILDRTRMLAAISHDLRTPLTRMRLRSEMIDDPEQRAKMLSDLAEMEEMVGATLAFAQEEHIDEPSQLLDLRRLLEAIVNEAREAGQRVMLRSGDLVLAPMRPRALKRGLVNIIDNAVRYGGAAEITMTRIADSAVVQIADQGPGIPVAERSLVLRPFYRCETSRSRETGGIGLGLSIASDVINGHGGSIELVETPGGGLTVEVYLPSVAARD